MAQTVRRCLPRPAAGRRARGLAVAAVVLTLVASLAPGASADNRDPVFPSQAEVDASKGTVAQKADQVGQIEAQLAAASVRADRLATDVARAVEAYNGARFRLQQAIQEALAAQQAAEAARAQVETARTELGRFAAAAYRSGGDLGGLSTFLVASGPRDLISRAAALQSIGDSRRHALENLRSAQAYATVLDRRAATMLDKRQEAAQRVERAKATAEARLETQRQAVGQIDAQRQTLVRALATARHTSVRLEQARQAGLAQARAEAARLAAERAAAAAARKAAAEAAAQAAEDARRSQAEKAQRDQEQRDADAKKAADQPASDPSPGNGGGGGGGGGASEPSAPNPPPSGSSSGSASGAEAAIDFAMAQMGKPYEWGADGPSTYDCSGLVMRAWQQGGVSLPHYSVEQYARSQPVALSDLRRGDLVFFASGSDYQSIYHVGLYIGSGQMIEAPYTGENVRISSIWRSSLFGAARP
jgi:cell wall-associated NlpC family hydrolase